MYPGKTKSTIKRCIRNREIKEFLQLELHYCKKNIDNKTKEYMKKV